jgi:Flp pilus assembly protein TadD
MRLALLILALVLITGCSTRRAVNWTRDTAEDVIDLSFEATDRTIAFGGEAATRSWQLTKASGRLLTAPLDFGKATYDHGTAFTRDALGVTTKYTGIDWIRERFGWMPPEPVMVVQKAEAGKPEAVMPERNRLMSFHTEEDEINVAAEPPPAAESKTPPKRQTGDLWNDPDFQRRFVESYVAVSDVEPEPLPVEERAVMAQNFQLFQQMMEAGNPDGALAFAKDNVHPEHPTFEFFVGNLYFQNNELDLAAEWYAKAADKFARFRRAHKNLGITHVRRGDFQAAIPSLTRAIELGDNDGILFGLLGFAYTSESNFLSAESAYRRAILMQPDTPDWKIGLARALFGQEKYAEAAALSRELIAKQPDNTDLWMLQANANLGMENHMAAAQSFEYLRLLGKAPSDTLNKLGDIYIKEKMVDMAAAAYIDAIDANPDQPTELSIRKANILALNGAAPEATSLVAKIREAGKLDYKQDIELLRLEARVAMIEGKDDTQADILEKIVEKDPTDGDALILLGQYHARNDAPELAALNYERAGGVEGFEARAKIRHAQLLVQQGDYSGAVPLLKSAQRIEHRDEVADYLTQVEAAAKTRQ